MTTYAVIMAGGAGTRFWPLSRRLRPKQLLSLLTERSLLIETVTRIAPAAVPFDQTLIVTGSHLADSIEAQVAPLGVEVSNMTSPLNFVIFFTRSTSSLMDKSSPVPTFT